VAQTFGPGWPCLQIGWHQLRTLAVETRT
jgi:hypothetical protein